MTFEIDLVVYIFTLVYSEFEYPVFTGHDYS